MSNSFLHLRTFAPGLALLIGGSALVAACTGSIGAPLTIGLGGGDGGTTVVSSTGATFNPSTTSGGGGNGFEECQGIENEATKIPVSMFLQIDKSGSMQDSNKWGNAKGAFIQFFKDPAAQQGLNVAMRFWPDGNCQPVTCS
ncbi:MAG: hypothetical protein FJ096_09195, partial [Deltaproteobacteria bacterium]|nr:hypothetical protein [Deltaproteobacteria bacterium]